MPTESGALDDAMHRSNATTPRAKASRAGRRIALTVGCAGLALAAGLILIDLTTPTDCGPVGQTRGEINPNGSLAQGIDLFHLNMGRLPRSLDELLRINDDDPARAAWTGPYVKDAAMLLDPWRRPYRYRIVGPLTRRDYLLWSAGPNGIDESSDGDHDFGDDLRNWK
ncbi:MAG TPA: type II secretion system protein GspG [Phycisphaerae bacterium]|nr:type II secretion system protein GspG [Phycisphaerae bacterium]HRW52476.1 type II secretion system protein GspG [Phycisphaerae bacterium]